MGVRLLIVVNTLFLMSRKLEESVENDAEQLWRWSVRAAFKCPARLGDGFDQIGDRGSDDA